MNVSDLARSTFLGAALALLTLGGLACGEDTSVGNEDAGGLVSDAGGPDGGSRDASSSSDAATGGAAFGAACTTDADCASNTCRLFGQLGQACTQTCTMPADCPAGSEGQKCNMNGLCRP